MKAFFVKLPFELCQWIIKILWNDYLKVLSGRLCAFYL